MSETDCFSNTQPAPAGSKLFLAANIAFTANVGLSICVMLLQFLPRDGAIKDISSFFCFLLDFLLGFLLACLLRFMPGILSLLGVWLLYERFCTQRGMQAAALRGCKAPKIALALILGGSLLEVVQFFVNRIYWLLSVTQFIGAGVNRFYFIVNLLFTGILPAAILVSTTVLIWAWGIRTAKLSPCAALPRINAAVAVLSLISVAVELIFDAFSLLNMAITAPRTLSWVYPAYLPTIPSAAARILYSVCILTARRASRRPTL